MKEYSFTVRDACGIHARPAGLLVRLAKGFGAKTTLVHGESQCDLTRLMALMGMGIKQGDTVAIRAEGPDEDACIAALADFLNKNL